MKIEDGVATAAMLAWVVGWRVRPSKHQRIIPATKNQNSLLAAIPGIGPAAPAGFGPFAGRWVR